MLQHILGLLPVALLASCATGVNLSTGGAPFEDEEFNGQDTDTHGFTLDVGRFYGRHIELGLRGGYEKVDAGGTETDTTEALLFGRWYTEALGTFRPFLELGGGIANVDQGALDVDGTVFFGGVGFMQFLTESAAGELIVRQSVGDFDNDIERDTLDIVLGFSFFF